MDPLLGSVCASISCVVLLWAGGGHLLNLRSFLAALHRQQLWPRLAVPFVAGILVMVELGIGGAGTVAIVFQNKELKTMALSASVILYSCFFVYAAFLLALRPTAPCGCSGSSRESTVSGWILGRSGVLALSSIVALVLRHEWISVWPSEGHGIIVVSAVVSLAIIVWSFPMAMGVSGIVRKDASDGF